MPKVGDTSSEKRRFRLFLLLICRIVARNGRDVPTDWTTLCFNNYSANRTALLCLADLLLANREETNELLTFFEHPPLRSDEMPEAEMVERILALEERLRSN